MTNVASIILNGEIRSISTKVRNKTRCLLFPLIFSKSWSLSYGKRQEKRQVAAGRRGRSQKISVILPGREVLKTPPENTFSKVTEYRISIQKPAVSLYTSKHLRKKPGNIHLGGGDPSQLLKARLTPSSQYCRIT